MSEAAVKALETVMGLTAEDRRWVMDRLYANDVSEAESFHPDQVPQDVQDEIMAEVERRMAEDEVNPTPGIPWPEALASLRARLAEHRAGR